jgi:SUKH-4 immunity protein of toxin-antitoxin system
MNLQLVEAAVARLPESYEPLLLTFYQAPLEVVEGAVVIGRDDAAELRVDLANGRVSSVGEGDLPWRFVNSSMDQLADAIAAYRDYAARVCDVDDDEATRLVQELRRRLEAMDAGSISDPKGWWSLVLEQAEDGLL